MKKDKKFLRQCAVCKTYKRKEDLIRITKNYKTGEPDINETDEINGRSVYICKNEDCIKKFIAKKGIEHALKTKTTENIKEKLYTVLKK